MKDVFLVYDRCCFYEIVILSYFLNYSPCDLVFCSPDGKPVRAMEGGFRACRCVFGGPGQNADSKLYDQLVLIGV